MTEAAELLSAYDDQLRGNAETASGVASDTDGPLVRVYYPHRAFVSYRSLDGVEDIDALIARQIEHFATLGKPFEWKTRGHDRPVDLSERLKAHGFVPEPRETVLVGVATEMSTAPPLPDGVRIRQVSERADFDRIAAMESEVWDEDWSWLADDLAERAAGSEIFAAEAGDQVVSAAWIVYKPGTDFAGLWGGSTLTAWRGRGLYRSLVAIRARRAVERGFKYLQVDASDDSRPILQRLGFVAITTTTPYIWTPADEPTV